MHRGGFGYPPLYDEAFGQHSLGRVYWKDMGVSLQSAIKWAAALLVACVAVWLWVSWINGWFPFGAHRVLPGQESQDMHKVIDSLSAPSTATDTAAEVPSGVLEQLSASAPAAGQKPAGATTSAVNTAPSPAPSSSVLDSLTPKQ